MSDKRVTIAIEVDSHFIRMLRANVSLNARIQAEAQLTPADVLSKIVLLEARGALEEQVHAAIPNEWRPHINMVGELRKVEEK